MANIAFDVDGVMTNLAKFQLDTGRKYFGEDSVKDPTKYDVKDIFDVSKKDREKYWLKYIWPYCITEEMRKNLSEISKKLKEDGHKIYIITGRVHTTEDGIRGKLFRKMLLSWLKKMVLNMMKSFMLMKTIVQKKNLMHVKKIILI